VHLRCPHCRAPIPERAARCPICRGDPHLAPATEPTPIPLAPRYERADGVPHALDRSGLWWRAAALLALVAAVALALVGLGALLAAAGFGEVAWPVAGGLASALGAGTVALLERQRAHRVAAGRSGDSPAHDPPQQGAAADLALVYLHAEHFAAPARGHAAVHAPLTQARVSAEDLAWRVVAATLVALADGEVVEMEAHALGTPAGPMPAVSVRVVRPLPPGEVFAASLLRPLVRRGVGGSTSVSDAVSQLVLARRRPATTVLAMVREQAVASGYLRWPGASGGTPVAVARGWLAAALLLPPRVDPARLAQADSALTALDERLAAWDARDPELVAALRAEVRAAFVRERARAGQGAG
jgi:hypothetical protein